MKNKNCHKRVTPEELQGIFLDIAQKIADNCLESFRRDAAVDYANRPEALNEDFFGLFDEFTQWKSGALMMPYDDVARLERFVRTAV